MDPLPRSVKKRNTTPSSKIFLIDPISRFMKFLLPTGVDACRYQLTRQGIFLNRYLRSFAASFLVRSQIFSPCSPWLIFLQEVAPSMLQDFLNRFLDDTFILVVDKMTADDPLFINQEYCREKLYSAIIGLDFCREMSNGEIDFVPF